MGYKNFTHKIRRRLDSNWFKILNPISEPPRI